VSSELLIASSRGKFNSINFNGTDGVQGPYFLSGLSGEKDIIIIAGTEKVFLDGIEMIRGENNDYIIEYSNASITFTPGRLITDASRIVADFEYTDRRYARNFFGTGVSSKFFNDDLIIGFQYLREGDDEDAPIDISFTDEDLQAITDAGDDPLNAVKSGVTLIEPDSLGIRRGIYQAIDTLINNEPYTYYFYNPGDSLALYEVRFSFVGEGNGDYRRDALGQYSFAGIDLGGYLPVIFLPLPQLKELGNFTISMTPIEKVHIDMEYAGSLWDKNKLSDLDDSDNFGYAANINVSIEPMQIQLGSINFGKIGLGYKDRFINKKFTSTDRFNVVEFDRIYNTTGSPEEEDEQFREFRVNYIPIDEFTFQSLAGFLIRGDDFKTDRYRNSIKLSDNEIYNAYYDLDYVKSRNVSISGNWLRQAGDASYLFWKIKPGINYLAEDKEDKQIGTDSLLSSSLKYYELSPYLQLIEFEGINLIAKYSLRDDFLPLNGLMEMEASSQAQIYEMNYRGIKEVTTTLNLTLRDKKFKEAFKQQGFLDTEQILVRSQSRFNFWEPILNGDLFYEVSTQKQARLQKVFVRVEKGTGNYRYVGDINENGIADHFEFECTLFDGDFPLITISTDELFPVIDLKTSTRWKINYEKIFDENTLIGTVLQPLSTETSWRIEEITKEEDLSKIYLMQLKYFQDDSVTIRGANFFLQDIFINENQQDLSFRFRYSQRISMSDFNTGIEKGYNRERSIRIRFRMVKEVSNQTDVVNITDNVSAPQPSAQNRQITDNSIASDFSYRPDKNIEIGFKLKVGRSEDDFPAEPTIIDLNSELIRINLSFAGTGRLRIELERTELLANTTQNFLPYELTAGNQLGKNYFWRLNFDYRLASFLQTTVSYDGRLQGSSKVAHTARAEARAYF